jgi:hypothetical protein
MVEGMRIGILEWNFSLLKTTETTEQKHMSLWLFFSLLAQSRKAFVVLPAGGIYRWPNCPPAGGTTKAFFSIGQGLPFSLEAGFTG